MGVFLAFMARCTTRAMGANISDTTLAECLLLADKADTQSELWLLSLIPPTVRAAEV